MTYLQVIKHNFWQTIISIDQFVHCFGFLIISIFCFFKNILKPKVWADETLSSHCWRWHINQIRDWPYKLIDIIFFWEKDHCKNSYESERNRRHLPPELR